MRAKKKGIVDFLHRKVESQKRFSLVSFPWASVSFSCVKIAVFYTDDPKEKKNIPGQARASFPPQSQARGSILPGGKGRKTKVSDNWREKGRDHCDPKSQLENGKSSPQKCV